LIFLKQGFQKRRFLCLALEKATAMEIFFWPIKKAMATQMARHGVAFKFLDYLNVTLNAKNRNVKGGLVVFLAVNFRKS